MRYATVPRLRDDAVVRPFDDRGRQARFVVAIDGHHFVVTSVVAAVLDETRRLRVGERDLSTLAARVADRLGREIPAPQIEKLLWESAPKRFFDAQAGFPAEECPVRMRKCLISAERLQPVLGILGWLFAKRVALAACSSVAIIDALVGLHWWRNGAEALTAADHLVAFALTLLGVLCHELGHLAVCRRYGAKHGGIGVGLYWCLPAFYAEVHGAWLLPRAQRAAVDAGGVYFQAIFVAALGALFVGTQEPALLAAIVLSHFLMLHTLNPVLKFDGYWLLCDLAGVPNLHHSLRELARRTVRGLRPNLSEAALLIAFSALAALYFAYTLGILGSSLGNTGAALRAAWLSADGSAMSLLKICGQATLLVITSIMAAGIATLLARGSRLVMTDDTATDLRQTRERYT